jgi:hypothetical protein
MQVLKINKPSPFKEYDEQVNMRVQRQFTILNTLKCDKPSAFKGYHKKQVCKKCSCDFRIATDLSCEVFVHYERTEYVKL